MSFEVGKKVQIHGLVKAPELNGVIGTLQRFDDDTGRWQVLVVRAGVQTIIGARPINLKVLTVEEDAVKSGLHRADAALRSSLESGCPICLEDFKPESLLHKFGCGHVVHSACWSAHSMKHGAEFISSRGQGGQSGARCPVCNAWDGPTLGREKPWYERTANELLVMALGYIFQSRWQAVGEDRSAEEEVAFIADRVRLAKAAGQYDGSLAGLTSTLARIRMIMQSHGYKQQLAQNDLVPELKNIMACLVPFVIVDRKPSIAAQSADDRSYVPHLMSWMQTIS